MDETGLPLDPKSPAHLHLLEHSVHPPGLHQVQRSTLPPHLRPRKKRVNAMKPKTTQSKGKGTGVAALSSSASSSLTQDPDTSPIVVSITLYSNGGQDWVECACGQCMGP